jgi:hypothetical protein
MLWSKRLFLNIGTSFADWHIRKQEPNPDTPNLYIVTAVKRSYLARGKPICTDESAVSSQYFHFEKVLLKIVCDFDMFSRDSSMTGNAAIGRRWRVDWNCRT